MFRALTVAFLFLMCVPMLLARNATDAVTISGDVTKAIQLSAADLAKFKAVSVELREHDGSVVKYKGVSITDLLKEAGIVVADHPGKAMAIMVAAIASDGYQVVFGLGELTPAISGRTIILAFEADGKPLGANVGPFRIVIEGDKMPVRCIRMVSDIRVTQLRK